MCDPKNDHNKFSDNQVSLFTIEFKKLHPSGTHNNLIIHKRSQ